MFGLFLGFFFFLSFTVLAQNRAQEKESHVLFHCIGSEFAPPSGRFENDKNTDVSIKEFYFFFCTASMNIVLFVSKPRAPVSFSENSQKIFSSLIL